jgi:hypothetical protein
MSVPRYLLLLLLAAGPAAAQAVEFDEKLKAPRAASGAELKQKLDGVAARVTGPNALNAIDAVRDRALARERFDARWMLGALVDARAPLPELEAMGFKARGDGSYTFSTRDNPEWRPLAENLLVLADPAVVTGLEGTFIARGFRPEDNAALKRYVEDHGLKRARDESQLALIISASRMAKKLQKLKRLDDNFMAAYFYQKGLALAQAEQQWAASLLDALEPRAQRILQSYFSEVASEGYIAPTSTADAYKYERELLLRPDFEQQAKTAFKEGRL